MRTVLAVDLAAKYSAACLLDTGQVFWQCDSWQRTETEFVDQLALPFRHPHEAGITQPPDLMAVEDLPHRLPFASLVKHVCRLQGRILQRMHDTGSLDRVLFIPPAEWRKAYAGLHRGTGPHAVTAVAAGLGYTPPTLTGRCVLRGDRAIARKVATDYAAAFLIGSWATHAYARTGGYDTDSTSRYPDTHIRKRRP